MGRRGCKSKDFTGLRSVSHLVAVQGARAYETSQAGGLQQPDPSGEHFIAAVLRHVGPDEDGYEACQSQGLAGLPPVLGHVATVCVQGVEAIGALEVSACAVPAYHEGKQEHARGQLGLLVEPPGTLARPADDSLAVLVVHHLRLEHEALAVAGVQHHGLHQFQAVHVVEQDAFVVAVARQAHVHLTQGLVRQHAPADLVVQSRQGRQGDLGGVKVGGTENAEQLGGLSVGEPAPDDEAVYLELGPAGRVRCQVSPEGGVSGSVGEARVCLLTDLLEKSIDMDDICLLAVSESSKPCIPPACSRVYVEG